MILIIKKLTIYILICILINFILGRKSFAENFLCVVWLCLGYFSSKLYKKTKRKKREEGKREVDSNDMPVLLNPKDRREYMLNHIEDGRFYVLSSLGGSDTTIVCAKRYDAEEQRLYCYAYLCICGGYIYTLHVGSSIKTIKNCHFLGNKKLSIGFDNDPRVVVFEEENISPYITDRDYNTFVQSLQAAGLEWNIEKDAENIMGSSKYLLKETII